MKKIRIGFLGYGTRALDALMEHPSFEVRYFFAPASRLCEDVFVAHEKYSGLDFTIVKNNNELFDALKDRRDVECFLINACPIIVKQKILDIMPFFNIHPGNLHTNRGHQPHMWTVLLGESSSTINLHRITPGIDEGLVISRRDVAVYPDDNSLMVLDRLEDEIPVLLDDLAAYLRGEGSPVEEIYGGIYRPIMKYEDYELSLSRFCDADFIEYAKRRILARFIKHGAFFLHKGSRVYVDAIINVTGSPDPSCKALPDVIFNNSLPGTVTLSSGSFSVTFHINHIEPVI